MDDGTLAQLSMRGLADRLGVTPMALYGHVVDKDDILDELLDVVLARDAAPPPPPEDSQWRPWMLRIVTDLRSVLLAQPVLLDRYLRAPVGVGAALDRMEAALGVLLAAGFDDEGAIEIYASTHIFTLGFTTLETARERSAATARPAAGLAFDASSPGYWPAYFGSLPVERFPVLARLRPDLADFTSAQRFERAVSDLLLSWRAPGEPDPLLRRLR